ncbi:hypothetical protein FRC03_002536 [Tulasnella sp. 419]|nr:hypothetical protein FRC02_004068 [Tulasnella sp. 418]KAG8943349.1 hypothetical protein FRC03_002536 [Tulasnella sp. 419]
MWNWLRKAARRCVDVVRGGWNIVRSATSSLRRGVQRVWHLWQTRVPTWLQYSVYGVLGLGVGMLGLYLIGFTPAGIAAGSVAAAWHSSIGIVAAGSLFASLQSVTMTAATYIGLGVSAGVLTALTAWFMSRGSGGPGDEEAGILLESFPSNGGLPGPSTKQM